MQGLLDMLQVRWDGDTATSVLGKGWDGDTATSVHEGMG